MTITTSTIVGSQTQAIATGFFAGSIAAYGILEVYNHMMRDFRMNSDRARLSAVTVSGICAAIVSYRSMTWQ